ncbi:restriction endonuclease [Clostridium tarantellae]|uniref:Restriction endonuclease type IV Mrr domain-containing protein n=1 Tax=Clostridium tarantellae TaxID=39493 RepID=A0A6I1MQZ1_9CLOT|nr:restriction endonuclease [Clostridium tarantellae]MPQ44878.1 hypothetical protein [Clostridium tarantellae]
MSFKTILLIFIGIFLINKILDKFIKLSQQIKKEKKEVLNINILKDFDNLVIKYLENMGYSNIVQGKCGEIIIYSDDGAISVGYKKTNETEDKISNEEVIAFIADMDMKGFKKGIFLTNGIIKNNIKNNFHRDIELKIIDGINFIIALKKIKLKEKNTFYMKEEKF